MRMRWWLVEFVPGKFAQFAISWTEQGAIDVVLGEIVPDPKPSAHIRVTKCGYYFEGHDDPPKNNSEFPIRDEAVMETFE